MIYQDRFQWNFFH